VYAGGPVAGNVTDPLGGFEKMFVVIGAKASDAAELGDAES
jgi:hypothetical protein